MVQGVVFGTEGQINSLTGMGSGGNKELPPRGISTWK